MSADSAGWGTFAFDFTPGDELDGKLIRVQPGTATLVLDGATVIDGRGGRTEGATVIVRGERVAYVGPPGNAPAESSGPRIDCRGMTVLPGLIDAHIHFMGNDTAHPIESHLRPSSGLRMIRAAFEFYQTLAAGFTTVRALGHGDPQHAYALRQAKGEGLIRGPRMLTSGWALSQTRGHGDVAGLPYELVQIERPRSAFCDGPDECRVQARRNFGEGADLIKIYTMDNRTGRANFTIDEIEAVVDEARRRGKRVASHAKSYESVRNAVIAGVTTIEHGPPAVHPDLLALMAERGTFLVPTLAQIHQVATEGANWGIPTARVEGAKRELDGRRAVAAKAREMGVRVVAGSDTGGRAGFGTLSARELELLVDAGLSPMEAIVAATAVAAQALGLDSDVGTVEEGKLADLLVVDGDPLGSIAILQDRGRLRYIIQSSDSLI